MATSKFLSLDGLSTLVSKIGNKLGGERTATAVNIYLQNPSEQELDSLGLVAASATLAGVMSAADKKKLDGIAAGGEVNQNAFSYVIAGGVTLAADAKQDTLSIVAGSNISITGTPGSDSLTIANTYKYTHATPGAKGTTLSASQTPNFGANFSIFNKILSSEEGHVLEASTSTVKIPALPNVTVTDKGNTAAADAGTTTVEVVKALANGSTSSNTAIYVDYTTVEVPTKSYVDTSISNGIAASNAMVIKGSYGGDSTGDWASTTTFSQGDTFVVDASGAFPTFGNLEVGDMIIAKKDGASKTTVGDWIVVQRNIDIYSKASGNVAGLVPAKRGTTASAAYFLNETGTWTVPTHRGIQVNGKSVYSTSQSGTVNFVPGTNLTITTGTAANSVTPITFAVDMDNVAAKSHNHTITANGEGDTWINVSKSNGTNAVTYNITHKGPDTSANTVYSASSTGSSNLTMGSSYVITGVKYDSKGHIIGVNSGKLPADQKGVTEVTITQGEGITVSNSGTKITETGTRTITLNAATTEKLGGIKVSVKGVTTTIDANRFGVKTTNGNVAYVEIAEITTAEINALF
jgi:hypothetical protein